MTSKIAFICYHMNRAPFHPSFPQPFFPAHRPVLLISLSPNMDTTRYQILIRHTNPRQKAARIVYYIITFPVFTLLRRCGCDWNRCSPVFGIVPDRPVSFLFTGIAHGLSVHQTIKLFLFQISGLRFLKFLDLFLQRCYCFGMKVVLVSR